jgi:hypothetical protein
MTEKNAGNMKTALLAQSLQKGHAKCPIVKWCRIIVG